MNYQLYPAREQTKFAPGPNTGYRVPDSVSTALAYGASVSIPSENTAFYFGGAQTIDGKPLLVSEMDHSYFVSSALLKVDLLQPGNAKWTNLTTPDDVAGRLHAELVWLPVGKSGMLVVIGGSDVSMILSNYAAEDKGNSRNRAYVETILLYDIASQRWFQQPTQGEIPQMLVMFCAVVAQEENSLDFNIYIYGGLQSSMLDGYDDDAILKLGDMVYILSLPSFTWTAIKSGTNAAHARSRHKCVMPFPNQMLVMGGMNFYDDSYCVSDGTVFDTLDLNTLEWQGGYDSCASNGSTYKEPSNIKAARSNSTTINIDPELSNLLSTPYSKEIEKFYPYACLSTVEHIEKGARYLWGSWISTFLGILLYLNIATIAFALLVLVRRRMLLQRYQYEVPPSGKKGSLPLIRWMNNTKGSSDFGFWAKKAKKPLTAENKGSAFEPLTLRLPDEDVELTRMSSVYRDQDPGPQLVLDQESPVSPLEGDAHDIVLSSTHSLPVTRHSQEVDSIQQPHLPHNDGQPPAH